MELTETANRPRRAAIAGFGAIAGAGQGAALPLTHAGAYAALAGRVSVVAIADTDAAARAGAQECVPDAQIYDDPAAMLAAERPDVMSVCAHAGSAPGLLTAARDAGVRGVWCEKPLAVAPGQIATLRDLAASGPAVQVNWWRCFVPEIAEMAGAIRAGVYGAVHHATGYYADAFANNGTHLLALARLCLGETGALHTDATGDAPLATARAPSGASLVCAPIPRRNYNIFELDILCERARIRFTENGRRIEVQEDHTDAAFDHLRILDTEPRTITCDWRGSFTRGLANLLDHLDDPGIELLSPLSAGIAVTEQTLAVTGAADAPVRIGAGAR